MARNSAWQAVQDDIDSAAAVLGIKFGPRTKDQQEHHELAAHVLLAKDRPQALERFINETAVLRRSLG